MIPIGRKLKPELALEVKISSSHSVIFIKTS